jgi:hypothetical protein
MMVRWEESHQGIFVHLRYDLQAEGDRHSRTAVARLDDFAPIVNFRKLIAIKRLVGARQHEQSPILLEYWRNSLLRVVEKTLSSEELAELFWSRIAGDPVSQV